MLGVMVDEGPIRERWLIVRDELDERGRRMWAAAEARSRGRGGIAAVVRATGISAETVRRGIAEVVGGERAPEGRVRRPGAGRKPIAEREPGLREALLALLEGATRGDPESPLLWTSRSVANLTAALRERGFAVHESTVRRQLRMLGYSLQANRKTREGADHPDRDGQFRHIVVLWRVAQIAGLPGFLASRFGSTEPMQEFRRRRRGGHVWPKKSDVPKHYYPSWLARLDTADGLTPPGPVTAGSTWAHHAFALASSPRSTLDRPIG